MSGDWDKAAGKPPNRDGSRRFITTEEAITPYSGKGTYQEELFGIDIKIRSGFNEDTISFVRVKPHSPKRSGRAGCHDWAVKIGLKECGGQVDTDPTVDASEPLAGYQSETTGDYRNANPEDPRGDGVYTRDRAGSPLTEQIADIVTREGGRVPCDFSASVQNEGYARSRDWTVYAPGYNPYHVAAAVTDLLQDTDGVDSVDVTVANKTAAEMANHLRITNLGQEFDAETEQQLVERILRELRWESGLTYRRRRELIVDPSDARQRIDEKEVAGLLSEARYEQELQDIARLPGDAWDYHEVHIHINEDAETPYHG